MKLGVMTVNTVGYNMLSVNWGETTPTETASYIEGSDAEVEKFYELFDFPGSSVSIVFNDGQFGGTVVMNYDGIIKLLGIYEDGDGMYPAGISIQKAPGKFYLQCVPVTGE